MQFSSGRNERIATHPVDDAGGVQVLDAAQHLVEEV